jgi:sugar transferase (PEP-CTERM/EpsH1 system associated)
MRILWLKTELLHPVDKGGRIRTYNMLKELKRNHHITYLALDDGTADENARALAAEYCQELICIPHTTKPKFSPGFYAELVGNMFSSLPYFMKKYQSRRMRLAIEEQAQDKNFDVLVCDFLQPSINIPEDLRVPAVLFQHNVEAMIWRRHYEIQKNPAVKAYLFGQWRRTVTYERKACRRFNMVIAVSEADRETMRSEYTIDKLGNVPTGVDTNYFSPNKDQATQPYTLVFTGSMDWLPNEDAIQFFIKQVMPIIRRDCPNVNLTIVGRNPYQSLIELGKRDPSIIVTGRVDDVRPYMDRAAAYVVPIRIGGGTRLKIYEAMAMAKPIISTTIGAEGLPVEHGRHLLIADSPEDFAAQVTKILCDPDLATSLALNSQRLVQEHFGWGSVSESFVKLCEQAIDHREPTNDKASQNN